MKNINIFIAGAKDLIEARRVFKVLANNLNAEYDSKHQDISLTMYSYEDFVGENNQMSYDDFIVADSDIVIFIIEGRIGAKTENEFKLASNNFSKHGRPKIYVFMKQYNEITPDIAYVNGLMSNMLADYYYDYRSYDHLESVAKDVLRDAVNDIVNKRAGGRDKRFGRAKMMSWLKMQRYAIMLLLLAFVSVLTLVLNTRHTISSDEPIVVVVGGGSVANYVEDSLKIDLNEQRDILYVHMPSMSAPSLLGEDIFESSSRYYTFLFSADKIDSPDPFYATTEPGKASVDGCVIGAYLGDDPLCVSVENLPIAREYIGEEDFSRGRISVDALIRILRDDERFSLYSTSSTSGTRRRYEQMLRDNDHVLAHYPAYSEDKSVVHKDNDRSKPMVLLASKFYSSKSLEDLEQLYLYDVVDGHEQAVSKSMYVYFVGYGKLHPHSPDKMRGEQSLYVYVPQLVVDFLNKLNIPTDMITKENYYKIKNDNDSFVFMYDKSN